MSMDPGFAAPQPDNPITRKVMGLPAFVWVGIIALGAYLFISHRSSSSAGSPTTTGGGGTATSGATKIQKGAIQVTIQQANPQPAAPVTGKSGIITDQSGNTAKVGSYTGSPGDLYNIAKALGMTEAQFLKLNPSLKKYEGTGKGVPTGTKINTGGGKTSTAGAALAKKPAAKAPSHPLRKAGAPHPAKKPAVHKATHTTKKA